MKKGRVVRPIEISGGDYDSFSRFLMSASSGDTVLIKSISSICHSLNELFNITSLANDRGVVVKSATESWYDTSNSDLSMLIGKLGTFYRHCITTSTCNGIERARKAGKQIGRSRGAFSISQDVLKRAYRDYSNGASTKMVCDKHSISRSTFYKYIHFNKLELKQL